MPIFSYTRCSLTHTLTHITHTLTDTYTCRLRDICRVLSGDVNVSDFKRATEGRRRERAPKRLQRQTYTHNVCKYPILLQGPTSSGKTSLIKYLAEATGHVFIR